MQISINIGKRSSDLDEHMRWIMGCGFFAVFAKIEVGAVSVVRALGEKDSKSKNSGRFVRLFTTYPHLYRMPVNGNWEQVSQATPSAEGLAVVERCSRLTVDCLHRFLLAQSPKTGASVF